VNAVRAPNPETFNTSIEEGSTPVRSCISATSLTGWDGR
jgi:hypothetical protein